jgi:hypothetical protein
VIRNESRDETAKPPAPPHRELATTQQVDETAGPDCERKLVCWELRMEAVDQEGGQQRKEVGCRNQGGRTSKGLGGSPAGTGEQQAPTVKNGNELRDSHEDGFRKSPRGNRCTTVPMVLKVSVMEHVDDAQ